MMQLLTSLWHRTANGGAERGGGSARSVRRPPAARTSARVVTTAESAPCTCPDFCERDHEND